MICIFHICTTSAWTNIFYMGFIISHCLMLLHPIHILHGGIRAIYWHNNTACLDWGVSHLILCFNKSEKGRWITYSYAKVIPSLIAEGIHIIHNICQRVWPTYYVPFYLTWVTQPNNKGHVLSIIGRWWKHHHFLAYAIVTGRRQMHINMSTEVLQ